MQHQLLCMSLTPCFLANSSLSPFSFLLVQLTRRSACTASGAGCVFLMSCTVLVHVYQVGWVLCVCCGSCLSELFLDACGLIAAGLVSRPTQWMTSRFQCWRLNLIESCSVSGLFAVVECVVLYAGIMPGQSAWAGSK